MGISEFTIFMSFFWNSFLIILIYLFRKNTKFILSFGIPCLVVLYIFCAFRTIFSFEFPFTVAIPAETVYNNLYQFVFADKISVGATGTGLTIFQLLLALWLIIAVILLIRFFWGYKKTSDIINQYTTYEDEEFAEIMNRVKGDSGKNLNVSVCSSPDVTVPMGVGIFNKKIILSPCDFDEDELYYVLRHEYTHFVNGDLIVKMLVHVFSCIFWWNPFVHLLKKDLGQMLEIKCDVTVLKKSENRIKAQYSSVLLNMYENSEEAFKPEQPQPQYVTTQLIPIKKKKRGALQSKLLKERISIIKDYKYTSRRLSNITIALLMALVCIISYSFVFQPRFDAPSGDIVTGEGITEITSMTNYYVLEHKDGTYSMVYPNGTMYKINTENLELLIESGFEIRKEE